MFFLALWINQYMGLLSDTMIDEILDRLDKTITELATESLEFNGNYDGVKNFLSSQYEIRLQNLLEVKKTNIHYLESGTKNKIIQRKQKLFENISTLF
jgi:hypothetical protein